jgi:hypothetical protein
MSSFKGWFLAIAFTAILAHSSSATSVYFDFGYDNSTSAGSNYNDVIIDGAGGVRPQPIVLANTIDSTGASTGIGLSVSGFFPGGNPNGAGTGGTSLSGAAAATFVASSAVDNVFTHVAAFGNQATNPKGFVVLSGLNDSKAYDFTIFASRVGVGDNRETKYTVTGSNSAITYLNAANNTSNLTAVTGIYPTAGSITINVEKGPNNSNGTGFAYLGAMRMDYAAVPEPTTLGLMGLSSLGLIFRRRFV